MACEILAKAKVAANGFTCVIIFRRRDKKSDH
jgi:hypothetical protein